MKDGIYLQLIFEPDTISFPEVWDVTYQVLLNSGAAEDSYLIDADVVRAHDVKSELKRRNRHSFNVHGNKIELSGSLVASYEHSIVSVKYGYNEAFDGVILGEKLLMLGAFVMGGSQIGSTHSGRTLGTLSFMKLKVRRSKGLR